jgi:succinate dehydrogenase flavin-adding protein (antitoxin of CptAB toxin-antitoxin module)
MKFSLALTAICLASVQAHPARDDSLHRYSRDKTALIDAKYAKIIKSMETSDYDTFTQLLKERDPKGLPGFDPVEDPFVRQAAEKYAKNDPNIGRIFNRYDDSDMERVYRDHTPIMAPQTPPLSWERSDSYDSSAGLLDDAYDQVIKAINDGDHEKFEKLLARKDLEGFNPIDDFEVRRAVGEKSAEDPKIGRIFEQHASSKGALPWHY